MSSSPATPHRPGVRDSIAVVRTTYGYLLVPVLLAAMVFGAALATYPPPAMIHDAYAYNAAAFRLLETGVYAYGPGPAETTVTPNARVTPAHVYVLAGSLALSGTDGGFEAAAREARPVWQAVQFLFALATVLFVGLSGHELGGRLLGWIAGIAAALFLPFGWATSVALAESMGAMLAAAQMWLALRLVSPRRPRTWRGALGLGIVSALAAMARPALIAWVVAPLVYAIIRRLESPRRLAMLAAVGALGFALVFAPWWARNALLLERFVPIRSDVVLVDGEYSSASTEAPARVSTGEQLRFVGRALTTPWMPQLDVLWENRFHYDEERVDFAEYPERLLESFLGWRQAWTYYQSLFVIAGLAGAVLLAKRSPRLLLVVSLPVYVVAIHFSTQINDRYLFPAMPALLLLGSASLWTVWGSLSSRLRRGHAAGPLPRSP
ncbi:MAG: ArnT family glycosyltransferase [Coriobacteriia bacterium]